MTSPEQRALADRVRADQAVWRNIVAEVGRERMDEPGPMGEWTFKDLAAHLGAWRGARIPMIEAIGRGEPPPVPPWPAEMHDDDEVNAWLQARDLDRPHEEHLPDIRAWLDRRSSG